jgi:hypothetical protein
MLDAPADTEIVQLPPGLKVRGFLFVHSPIMALTQPVKKAAPFPERPQFRSAEYCLPHNDGPLLPFQKERPPRFQSGPLSVRVV